MKSKTNELRKNIQNVSNSSIYYILKTKVLRSDMTQYQNLNDSFSIKVGHSFQIRNPWKGRSVRLQLDGDINPSKNTWMGKCNIFECMCKSHTIEILEFTLTFQIKKLIAKALKLSMYGNLVDRMLFLKINVYFLITVSFIRQYLLLLPHHIQLPLPQTWTPTYSSNHNRSSYFSILYITIQHGVNNIESKREREGQQV